MDGSATRRGRPHDPPELRRRATPRRAGSGEARRFGEGVAILVGDLAFVYADQLLHGAPPPAWDDLERAAHRAQHRPVPRHPRHRSRASASRATAERIARYKSGKYTVERPLHLGAVLAAPDRAAELLPALSAYGLPLGDAFQLRDDVLGAFGDDRITGKPVGDDLREGKPTPLLAMATGPRRRRPRPRCWPSSASPT